MMVEGTVLHYRLLEQMGAGGMGVVYRAVDTRLGRHVALKFLPETAHMDATARRRLVSEAQAAAMLDHPNVGVIYGIEDIDDRPFIVMALYEGESLRGRIDRSPLDPPEAVDIALQAARGLAVAHACGIVHRDVKPDNLFLAATGIVKVLDFGLAKRDELADLTSAGAVVGTLDYMSPEQIRGQSVDLRTDIWALGVVLYEMLTGVSPFHAEGGMTASILRIIKDEPEPLTRLRPDAPARLVAVVERALAKDCEQRYSSIAELIVDLERVFGGTSTSSTSPSQPSAGTGSSATGEAGARGTTTATSGGNATAPTAPRVAPQQAHPPTQPAAPPVVLPAATSPLVGRQDELAIIATNLADPHCRVLTLVGPGGTGKTRLVLEAARKEADRSAFPGGVYFVPLDGIADPDLIPSAIARALGAELQPQEPPLPQLQRHIGDREMLLVMDNYEHVMAGAHCPAELAEACPGLRTLVTSRERLNLEEEWVLPIPGLVVPNVEKPTHEEALQYASVQLFVHRAKRASLHFSLENEDPHHVCTICRLVGGSPLAIELAAVWVKMMPCEEIAREIQSSIDFLTSSSRNVSERHRSIRASFEYSWVLLTPKERDVFARLSVLQGSFTREAAADVAGASLPILAMLVDKSLLHVEAGRYSSHPILHQYAAEKLAENSQVKTESADRHGAYYLRFVQESVGRDDELARLDSEVANILAAMNAAAERGDGVTLVAMMRLLAIDGAYYSARGHTPRSRDLLREAVAAAKQLDELMVAHRLLGKLGDVDKLYLGDLDSALKAYRESFEIAERLQDASRQVVMLSLIGQTRFEQGADDADAFLDQALEIARANGDARALSHVLQHKGFLAGGREDWESAHRLFGEALEALEPASGRGDEAQPEADYERFMAILNLGEAERALGRFDRALELRQRALSMAEERDNRLWKAYAVHELGEVYHSMDQRDRARQSFEQALELWKQSHVPRKVESLRAFMRAEGYLGDGSDVRSQP